MGERSSRGLSIGHDAKRCGAESEGNLGVSVEQSSSVVDPTLKLSSPRVGSWQIRASDCHEHDPADRVFTVPTTEFVPCAHPPHQQNAPVRGMQMELRNRGEPASPARALASFLKCSTRARTKAQHIQTQATVQHLRLVMLFIGSSRRRTVSAFPNPVRIHTRTARALALSDRAPSRGAS